MISVVIPVFNEKESVGMLHEELLEVLRRVGEPFEIIFVDDGSTDGTTDVLKHLSPAKVVSFSRNFGKSQALQAGFRTAEGDWIFTMDGDLQDDPNEIPKFLEKLKRDQLDLVCGWKEHRLDSFAKRMVSKLANGLTRAFTGTKVHDMNCGFKLYRKEVAKTIELHGDIHRYIPALAAAQGFTIGEVSVNHRKRQFGHSKYGNFRRLFKSGFDFVTLLLIRKFIDRPMHFFGIVGSALLVLGGGILGYLGYLKVAYGEAIGHRPLLMLGVLLAVIGVQLFSSGFLGELLIRQNGRKDVYVVRETVDNRNS